jgi:hypothetical protein
MDQGLPLVPIVFGVLLAYAGWFAHSIVRRTLRTEAIRTSRR